MTPCVSMVITYKGDDCSMVNLPRSILINDPDILGLGEVIHPSARDVLGIKIVRKNIMRRVGIGAIPIDDDAGEYVLGDDIAEESCKVLF